MAAPEIEGVEPAEGLAWGGDTITISGSGFGPRARVLFGGQAAPWAVVVSSEEILVITPHGEPGAVAVAVANLDAAGEAVEGEEGSSAGAFTFTLPDLAAEDDLARLARTMIRLFKREVVGAVLPESTAVDYSEDPDGEVRVIEVSETPSVVLAGPRITENLFHRRVERRLRAAGGGAFEVIGPGVAVDLTFGVTVNTRSKIQALALQAAVIRAIRRNPRVEMLRVAGEPESAARWPLRLGEFRSSPPRGGLHVASADLRVVGFELDEGAVVERVRPIEVIDSTVEAL